MFSKYFFLIIFFISAKLFSSNFLPKDADIFFDLKNTNNSTHFSVYENKKILFQTNFNENEKSINDEKNGYNFYYDEYRKGYIFDYITSNLSSVSLFLQKDGIHVLKSNHVSFSKKESFGFQSSHNLKFSDLHSFYHLFCKAEHIFNEGLLKTHKSHFQSHYFYNSGILHMGASCAHQNRNDYEDIFWKKASHEKSKVSIRRGYLDNYGSIISENNTLRIKRFHFMNYGIFTASKTSWENKASLENRGKVYIQDQMSSSLMDLINHGELYIPALSNSIAFQNFSNFNEIFLTDNSSLTSNVNAHNFHNSCVILSDHPLNLSSIPHTKRGAYFSFKPQKNNKNSSSKKKEVFKEVTHWTQDIEWYRVWYVNNVEVKREYLYTEKKKWDEEKITSNKNDKKNSQDWVNKSTQTLGTLQDHLDCMIERNLGIKESDEAQGWLDRYMSPTLSKSHPLNDFHGFFKVYTSFHRRVGNYFSYNDTTRQALVNNSSSIIEDQSFFHKLYKQGENALTWMKNNPEVILGAVLSLVESRARLKKGAIAHALRERIKGKTSGNGFSGRRGFELENHKSQITRNSKTRIENIDYSSHALDQMQNRGIPHSVVKNTLNKGVKYGTRSGTQGYYDASNNVRVIINSKDNKVITVIWGKPNV